MRLILIALLLAGCAGRTENETKATVLYCLGFCLEVDAESESDVTKDELPERKDDEQ